MSKGGIIDIIAVLFIIAACIIGYNYWQNTQPQISTPSDQKLLAAIIRDRPSLSYKNQPIIQITNTVKPADGWYIVTIKSLHVKQDFVPVRILLAEENNNPDNLRVILGPEADFSDDVVGSVSLPNSVIMELQKS